tara:strand:+ start:523 stop:771 length:249 start_codon:yes stop_codon:yes gene_type:complete
MSKSKVLKKIVKGLYGEKGKKPTMSQYKRRRKKDTLTPKMERDFKAGMTPPAVAARAKKRAANKKMRGGTVKKKMRGGKVKK